MIRLLFFIGVFSAQLTAQNASIIESIHKFQKELNTKFSDIETSPLPEEEVKTFTSLSFFMIDTTYRVKAKFVRTPYETPFIMKTTTNREPIYVKYGEAHFTLLAQDFVVNIYQNQSLVSRPEYKNYLFFPFTDVTNGATSYAGGRFIDLTIPEDKWIYIDFNKAYSPYCAYNDQYSCPVPPEENHLPIAILAGVKHSN